MAPSPDGSQPVETAIADALSGGDEMAALRVIATSTLLFPQAGSADVEEGSVTLPVLVDDETEYVPAFTSEERLQEVMPETEQVTVVTGAQVASAWPEHLWMALNPGSPGGVTLPPDVVRALGAIADEDPPPEPEV